MKFSRNKRKRQPIGMLGRGSGNHEWLLSNASACVSCGFRLRNARTQAIAFEWKPGLTLLTRTARVGRRELFAVRLDGRTQPQRLVVEVDVLKRVAEAEVWQDDVEQPCDRLRYIGETHARRFEHVCQYHRTRHCQIQNDSFLEDITEFTEAINIVDTDGVGKRRLSPFNAYSLTL